MTERLRNSNPYGAYCQGGDSRQGPRISDEGLGTKKTMLVLVVVVGCFAVLWPKLFYPMLVNNANSHIKPGPVDKTTGCCDVISEVDVDTIKIMSELCSTIIEDGSYKPANPKEIVAQCKKAILETCGIDISAALQGRISLGHSVKQILEEVRSLNGSLCLKYNFGLSPWKLGIPHRVHLNVDPINNIKQERSSHMRPGMVHPAFRERGRAIPETDPSITPKKTGPPPRIVEGRPGPIPGMRPAMGGPGHVVTPSKQSTGFTSVLMPIYTIGFAIFFSYTIMKLVFKKKPDPYGGAPLYPPCDTDEQFHKDVFEANRHYFNRPNRDTSKIVVNAVAALLEEVNQEIEAHKNKAPAHVVNEQDKPKPNGSLPKEEDTGSVTVMAMETTASSESGKQWSRPDSPVLPQPHPALSKEPSPPPKQIFLEGALPPQSQILVADSATEAQKNPEDDSPVVLSGKMTLSVISLDSETGTEESSNTGKNKEEQSDDERRSSSNISDEFEKVSASDLEDQIDNIIQQAENIALVEAVESNILGKIEKGIHFEDGLQKASHSTDILEEFLEKEKENLLRQNEKLVEKEKNKILQEIVSEDSSENKDIIEEPVVKNEEVLETFLVKEQKNEKQPYAGIKEKVSPLEPLTSSQIMTEKTYIQTGDEDHHERPEEPINNTMSSEEKNGGQGTIVERKDEEKNEEVKEVEDKLSNELISDDPIENTELIDHERIISQYDDVENHQELSNSNILGQTQTERESKKQDQVRFKLEEPSIGEILKVELSENEPTEEENRLEKSVKNMADVLLQGLLGRDQEEITPGPSTQETNEDVEAPAASGTEEQVIEDIEYGDESNDEEMDEDELRQMVARYEDRDTEERRLNGEDADSSRNRGVNSETAAENEISEDDLENEDDEEIEEIIEYVDNTDEEGEEIIEINGNERRHLNENGAQ